MKKKKAKPARSARGFPRPPVLIVTALVVVVIAAITVVSRQPANGEQSNGSEKVMTNVANTKYTTVKVAGQDVQVDPQTGKMKPLTPEEAKRLAEGLKGMLNKSTEGLVEVQHVDGSKSMDLNDRFQNVTVARENEDGTLSQSCVDSPRAAAAFFGIDRKLLERDGPQVPKTPDN